MLQDTMPIIIDLPKGKDVIINPIGDLHYGSREFRENEFKDYLKRVKDTDNYIVLVGDMMDNGIKSSVTSCYTPISPMAQKEWLYEQLEPTKEKIIGAVGGNHERRTIKEVDSDPLYDVMCRLHMEERYRQTMAFIFLRIGQNGNCAGKYRPTYTICLTHGVGGGQFVGTSSTKCEKFGSVIDGLDLLITGHTHRQITYPVGKLKIDTQNKKIIPQQFTVVTCSSWLDYGGYPLQKMLPPTSHGVTDIHLSSTGKTIRVTQ